MSEQFRTNSLAVLTVIVGTWVRNNFIAETGSCLPISPRARINANPYLDISKLEIVTTSQSGHQAIVRLIIISSYIAIAFPSMFGPLTTLPPTIMLVRFTVPLFLSPIYISGNMPARSGRKKPITLTTPRGNWLDFYPQYRYLMFCTSHSIILSHKWALSILKSLSIPIANRYE